MERKLKLTDIQTEELHTVITAGASKGPEVRRAQAILLVNDRATPETIKTITGLSRKHAFTLRRRYIDEGVGAIQDQRKGSPKELLTSAQREAIVETIKAKTPNDCDPYYHSDYWTTRILGEYIRRTYNVQYKSKTSYRLLFRSATFTYHKPGKVSDRRSDEEVRQWRIDGTKRIREVWDDPNTVILAEDEMHLSTQTTVQKIWLPQGEYPKIEVYRKRESRSLYGFLNIKNGKQHAFKTNWQNMHVTATIVPRIRKCYPNKKILLIWDKAGWHKGRVAQEAIAADGHIDQIYFPTAAPELNPQEHVWKSGRSHVTHNVFIKNIDAATDAFVTYLNTTRFPYSLLGFSAIS